MVRTKQTARKTITGCKHKLIRDVEKQKHIALTLVSVIKEVKEMTDTIHERSLILNAKESLNLVKQRLLVLQKAVDDSLCLVDKRASIRDTAARLQSVADEAAVLFEKATMANTAVNLLARINDV